MLNRNLSSRVPATVGALVVCLVVALSAGYLASAQAADPTFACLTASTKVRHTYVNHPDPAKLKEAVRIFESQATGVDYPVGTVIQMVPNEAMVKRTKAEFPNSNGWEFFLLDVTAQGATVKMRGDAAANRLGRAATRVGSRAPQVPQAPEPQAGGGLSDLIFGKGPGNRQSVAEAAIKSATRSISSTVGRQVGQALVRGILGGLLRK